MSKVGLLEQAPKSANAINYESAIADEYVTALELDFTPYSVQVGGFEIKSAVRINNKILIHILGDWYEVTPTFNLEICWRNPWI